MEGLVVGLPQAGGHGGQHLAGQRGHGVEHAVELALAEDEQVMSVSEITLAERGRRSSRASSPKYWPGPSVACLRLLRLDGGLAARR